MLCNGKEIVCVPNMLHKKASRYFMTQKYKMI